MFKSKHATPSWYLMHNIWPNHKRPQLLLYTRSHIYIYIFIPICLWWAIGRLSHLSCWPHKSRFKWATRKMTTPFDLIKIKMQTTNTATALLICYSLRPLFLSRASPFSFPALRRSAHIVYSKFRASLYLMWLSQFRGVAVVGHPAHYLFSAMLKPYNI